MEFCSNWLRLITLCENVTLFWSCGPDCNGNDGNWNWTFSNWDVNKLAPKRFHHESLATLSSLYIFSSC